MPKPDAGGSSAGQHAVYFGAIFSGLAINLHIELSAAMHFTALALNAAAGQNTANKRSRGARPSAQVRPITRQNNVARRTGAS
jgi:hypothetical protein